MIRVTQMTVQVDGLELRLQRLPGRRVRIVQTADLTEVTTYDATLANESQVRRLAQVDVSDADRRTLRSLCETIAGVRDVEVGA